MLLFRPWTACSRMLSELGCLLANGATGMSDIEGKVAREAMSECGQRASFNPFGVERVKRRGRHAPLRRCRFWNAFNLRSGIRARIASVLLAAVPANHRSGRKTPRSKRRIRRTNHPRRNSRPSPLERLGNFQTVTNSDLRFQTSDSEHEQDQEQERCIGASHATP
jgi:hypothetical protein